MKFNPSDAFISAACAAGRIVTPKVSIKKTSARDELLTDGTWNDVTDHISRKDIQAIQKSIEINLSQFSADKITLTGLDLPWWETNYFGYANFLELKIEYVLNSLVAEPVPVFSGWIEKEKNLFAIQRYERGNCVKFPVWSYIDFADGVWASTVLRQYVDFNVDGSGTEGLSLPHINNLFVIDANVTSYALKKGVHTINYQIASGPLKQAQLDDGDWTTLSTGSNVLSNKKGDQKIDLYAQSSIPGSGSFSETIVVDSPGDTLPKNWYYAISARAALEKLFNKAGITTLSFDDLNYPTASGNPKISYFELVADNESLSASRTSVIFDGTYWWFGVSNKLYRRDSIGTYVLKQTLSSGYLIRRIFYDARNGQLWILAASDASYGFDKVFVYTIASNSISSELSISISGTTPSVHSAALIDCNFLTSGAAYKYALIYTDEQAGLVREITLSGSTLTATTIYTAAGSLGVRNFIVYLKNLKEVYFLIANASSGVSKINKMHVDGTGSWVNDGLMSNGASSSYFTHGPAAYNYTDNKIYYAWIENNSIYSWTPDGIANTPFQLITAVQNCETIVSDGADNVFLSLRFGTTEQANNILALSDNTVKELTTAGAAVTLTPKKQVYTQFGGLYSDGSILWGVDIYGKFFKYDSTISLFIETAKYDGMTVRAAIEKICQSFNLLYKISSTKSARIQRRSDHTGAVLTTGGSVDLVADLLSNIDDDLFYNDGYDIIHVGNGNDEVNYDGSVYDAVAFDQELVLPIDSDFIPDEILEDLAFNLYAFFSVRHKIANLPCPASLMQYECLDGATITYTGKMSLSNDGVIIADSVDPVGRMQFKVLVNA